MKVEGAMFSLERIASPRYRRFRYRNRDGSYMSAEIARALVTLE
jgi:hypothetical protein